MFLEVVEVRISLGFEVDPKIFAFGGQVPFLSQEMFWGRVLFLALSDVLCLYVEQQYR